MWIAARLVIILANVLAFSTLRFERSNFGFFAGLLCGVVTFVGLFLWMRAKGKDEERTNFFDAPFFPMMRYPRTYWLTVGMSIMIASLINILFYFQDMHAVQLFGGLMALGAGMTSAVVGLLLLEKKSNS